MTMKHAPVLAIAAVVAFAVATLWAGEQAGPATRKQRSAGEQVVPKGKVYAILDERGKVLARYDEGSTMKPVTAISKKKTPPKGPDVNCAKIKCPSNFPTHWVCWECR